MFQNYLNSDLRSLLIKNFFTPFFVGHKYIKASLITKTSRFSNINYILITEILCHKWITQGLDIEFSRVSRVVSYFFRYFGFSNSWNWNPLMLGFEKAHLADFLTSQLMEKNSACYKSYFHCRKIKIKNRL